jgi:hypothetical protein
MNYVSRRFRFVVAFLMLAGLGGAPAAHGQDAAKYGADFLAGGVGARALGMGGAQVALTRNVNAGYWNASGLSNLDYPQGAYMHVERFAGVVSFDYGGVAMPITNESTVGLSFYRSGVNNIKNTLNAWNAEEGRPRANPENYFSTFSAADYAFFVSYARRLSERLNVGVTGKVIRRIIGPFANAWGYSFDVSAQYRLGRLVLGANIQDVSTMLQSWSVNPKAYNNSIDQINPDTGDPYTFEEMFAFESGGGGTLPAQLPQGGTFRVLPVARLGSGYVLPIGEHSMTVGLDMDVAFNGQRANVPNAGDVSFHPRLGTEFNYRGIVALRAGLKRVLYASDDYGFSMTPTVGAGLKLNQVNVNYGFGDFAGLSSDLGYSHRISVRLTLEQPGLQRAE